MTTRGTSWRFFCGQQSILTKFVDTPQKSLFKIGMCCYGFWRSIHHPLDGPFTQIDILTREARTLAWSCTTHQDLQLYKFKNTWIVYQFKPPEVSPFKCQKTAHSVLSSHKTLPALGIGSQRGEKIQEKLQILPERHLKKKKWHKSSACVEGDYIDITVSLASVAVEGQ